MYRYAQTKNRVHRVIVEGGKAFKVEQCNLDDAAFTRLEDIAPEGTHCAYCWAGWVAPTEEQKEKAEEEVRAFKEQPEAKAVPIVQSTRRMAIAALAAAALLGGAAGAFAASGDPTAAVSDNTDIVALRQRIDDLFVQVRVLSVDINGHTHEQAPVPSPQIIIVPGPTLPPTAEPSVAPTATPSVTPTDGTGSRSGSDGSANRTGTSTTIIVVQPPAPTAGPGINPVIVPTPPPTPAPTPQPTSTPTLPSCLHPGVHIGVDPCRWPHQP